ncbi:MAG: hypothetical protein Q8P72_00860 [Candidatus Roizmanbacteria bacterium]|nr:hypothetical protein [Candidatus Roizmanbacteria bacterium]
MTRIRTGSPIGVGDDDAWILRFTQNDNEGSCTLQRRGKQYHLTISISEAVAMRSE